MNDSLSLKYIFGYTDYFYDRTTDTDLTNGPFLDEQFYVSQETEYVSHELQAFWDPTESLSVTTGVFVYDAKITQRADFFDTFGLESRYANDFPVTYGTINPALGFLDILPKMDLFTARNVGERANDGAPLPFNCLDLSPVIYAYCFGKWEGDRGDRIPHGPATSATVLEYQTRTERAAYAGYTQGVYSFNEHWALTLGVRWARDDLEGEENLFFYAEDQVVPLGFPATGGTSSLAAINQAFGWLGPNGEILDPQRLLVGGLPVSISIWRELDRSDEDVTWRANLDWTPNDDTLIYLSATSGFRSGGFNLVFFSDPGKFPAEHLIAYELGYKGALLDSRLQVNSAIYFYDYENVHTFANGVGAFGYSTNIFAAPKAEMIGWDTDFIWLITDQITLGANFSYTHSEYTDDLFVIDPTNHERPASLFDPTAVPINAEGNQMLRVPEAKGGAYASYTFPVIGGSFELLANWSWISRVYYSVFENKDQSAPSYQRLDLRGTWTSSDNGWMVAAFVNNVMDEIGLRQIEQYGATEESGYLRTGTGTDPRLFGLEVRYRFGAAR